MSPEKKPLNPIETQETTVLPTTEIEASENEHSRVEKLFVLNAIGRSIASARINKIQRQIEKSEQEKPKGNLTPITRSEQRIALKRDRKLHANMRRAVNNYGYELAYGSSDPANFSNSRDSEKHAKNLKKIQKNSKFVDNLDNPNTSDMYENQLKLALKYDMADRLKLDIAEIVCIEEIIRSGSLDITKEAISHLIAMETGIDEENDALAVQTIRKLKLRGILDDSGNQIIDKATLSKLLGYEMTREASDTATGQDVANDNAKKIVSLSQTTNDTFDEIEARVIQSHEQASTQVLPSEIISSEKLASTFDPNNFTFDDKSYSKMKRNIDVISSKTLEETKKRSSAEHIDPSIKEIIVIRARKKAANKVAEKELGITGKDKKTPDFYTFRDVILSAYDSFQSPQPSESKYTAQETKTEPRQLTSEQLKNNEGTLAERLEAVRRLNREQ